MLLLLLLLHIWGGKKKNIKAGGDIKDGCRWSKNCWSQSLQEEKIQRIKRKQMNWTGWKFTLNYRSGSNWLVDWLVSEIITQSHKHTEALIHKRTLGWGRGVTFKMMRNCCNKAAASINERIKRVGKRSECEWSGCANVFPVNMNHFCVNLLLRRLINEICSTAEQTRGKMFRLLRVRVCEMWPIALLSTTTAQCSSDYTSSDTHTHTHTHTQTPLTDKTHIYD